MDGFEKRELVGEQYWNDHRWEQVKQLRENNENAKANALVFQIRASYGLD